MEILHCIDIIFFSRSVRHFYGPLKKSSGPPQLKGITTTVVIRKLVDHTQKRKHHGWVRAPNHNPPFGTWILGQLARQTSHTSEIPRRPKVWVPIPIPLFQPLFLMKMWLPTDSVQGRDVFLPINICKTRIYNPHFPLPLQVKKCNHTYKPTKTTTLQPTRTIANLLPSPITPPNDRGRLKPMRTPMVLASFLLAIKSPKRLAALCVTDLKAADGLASWPERSGWLADLPQYRGGRFFWHLEFL